MFDPKEQEAGVSTLEELIEMMDDAMVTRAKGKMKPEESAMYSDEEGCEDPADMAAAGFSGADDEEELDEETTRKLMEHYESM